MREKYVALVIGNRQYVMAEPVKNAAIDATEISASFDRLHYERYDLHLDCNANELDNAVTDFHNASVGAKLCVMYYAGHSVQVDGVNYLLAVETVLDTHRSLRRFGLRLDEILDGLKAEMSVLILDSCRDNPFRKGVFARDETARAAATRLDQPADPEIRQSRSAGILFATSRGKKASADCAVQSGRSKHSPLAQALLDHLKTPDITFGTLASNAIGFVKKATCETQVPWWMTTAETEFAVAPRTMSGAGEEPGATEPMTSVSSARTVSATGAPINLSIPENVSFGWLASMIGEFIRRPVTLDGFTENETNAPLRPHQLYCRNPTEALMALRALAKTGTIRKYMVADENYNLVIKPLEQG